MHKSKVATVGTGISLFFHDAEFLCIWFNCMIKYKDGTEQNIKGYDFIPDTVMELFDNIDGYFEVEPFDGEFDAEEK